MRELLAGIALLVVLGFAGLFYRNTLTQHAYAPLAQGCPADMQTCPDGTQVSRVMPGCAFAACPAPRETLAAIGASFTLPAGYVRNASALGSDTTLVAAYEKPAKEAQTYHAIVVREYPIPTGKTSTDVILANTIYESSGGQPQSLSELTPITVGGRTYYRATLERFEGQVHTAYCLPRSADVLRFEVLERDVTDWTDPALSAEDLPEHQALHRLLSSLQLP